MIPGMRHICDTGCMRSIKNSEELLRCFREIDIDKVKVTSDIEFPLWIEDYFAWQDPSRDYTYLIYMNEAGKPVGLSFRQSNTRAVGPNMCNLCHSVSSSKDVCLLTAASSKRVSVGVHACRDLSCKDKIINGPSLNDMRESMQKQQKVDRLLHKMGRFIKRHIV